MPEQLVSENGCQFTSEWTDTLCVKDRTPDIHCECRSQHDLAQPIIGWNSLRSHSTGQSCWWLLSHHRTQMRCYLLRVTLKLKRLLDPYVLRVQQLLTLVLKLNNTLREIIEDLVEWTYSCHGWQVKKKTWSTGKCCFDEELNSAFFLLLLVVELTCRHISFDVVRFQKPLRKKHTMQ